MALRRMKTYAGGQGYVYQYYFVGKRAALPDRSEDPATEYIFDVTSDRKTTFAVSVIVHEKTVERWSANHGRPLTEAEQYAAAKMRLLRGFDEVVNMMADGRQLAVNTESLEQTLATLGVD